MEQLVIVLKDGEPISDPMTENEAFVFILRHQGQSFDYATTYGGYAVEDVGGNQ